MHTWEQTYPVQGSGQVAIEQLEGALRITGWDQPVVKLTASSGDKEALRRVSVRRDGSDLYLEVEPQQKLFSFGHSPVDLALMVPFGFACHVETASGPVEVRGTQAAVNIEVGSGTVAVRDVQGPVSVESGSGAVDVAHIRGVVTVEVGSGNVSARRIEGSLELETGSGTLVAERVRGSLLKAETGGGSIRAVGLDVAELELTTGSGHVEAELTQVHRNGSYEVETGSGGVLLAVPPGADLHVELSTESGRISHSGLNLRVEYAEPGELRAVLNQGGPELRVTAGSGAIALRASQGSAGRVDNADRRDEMKRILTMVEEGKISPAEAEALLQALDEAEGTA